MSSSPSQPSTPAGPNPTAALRIPAPPRSSNPVVAPAPRSAPQTASDVRADADQHDAPPMRSFPFRRPILSWRTTLAARYPTVAGPIFEQWDRTQHSIPSWARDRAPFALVVLLISPRLFFVLLLCAAACFVGSLYGAASQRRFLSALIDDYSRSVGYGTPKARFRSRLAAILGSTNRSVSSTTPASGPLATPRDSPLDRPKNMLLASAISAAASGASPTSAGGNGTLDSTVNDHSEMMDAADFASFMRSLVGAVSDARIKQQLLNVQRHHDEQMSLDLEFAVVEDEVPFTVLELINRIAYRVVRDFIYNWFENFNHSKQSDFPKAVHGALKYAVIRVGLRGRRLMPLDVIVPCCKAAIFHIQQYREFEDSRLTVDEYTKKFPKSYFSQCSTDKEVISRLRDIAMRLIADILPRNERSSEALFSLLTELISTTVFLPLVNLLSDPDWLNQKIVESLENEQEREARLEADPMAAANAAGVANVKAHADAELSGVESVDSKILEMQRQLLVRTPDVAQIPPVTDASSSPVKDTLYCADVDTVLNSDAGKLVVSIVEGRRLHITKNANFVYCTIMSGVSSKYTRKLAAEVDPMWYEEFTFKLSQKDKKAIKAGQGVPGIVVDVYESRLLKDELLGSVHVPFDKIPMNKKVRGWFFLDCSETRFAKRETSASAQVLIEMLFEDPKITQLLNDGKRRREASQPIRRMSSNLNGSNRNSGIHSGLGLLEPTLNEDGTFSIVGSNGNKVLLDAESRPFITAKMILIENEAFMEFMVYMDDMKSSDYIQLWVMIDSFVRLAASQGTADSNSYTAHNEAMQEVKEDATGILDLYFPQNKPGAVQTIDLGPGIDEIISSIRTQIAAMVVPEPAVMRPLQERILQVIQDSFVPGFLKTEKFKQYLNDIGIKLNVEGQIAVGNTGFTPLVSPSIKNIAMMRGGILNGEPQSASVESEDKSPATSVAGIDMQAVTSVAGHIMQDISYAPISDGDSKKIFEEPESEVPQSAENIAEVDEINIESSVSSSVPPPVPERSDSTASFGADIISSEENAMQQSLLKAASMMDDIQNRIKAGTVDLNTVRSGIELLKEQVHVLDKIMEVQTDATMLKELSAAKLQLQRNVEELSDIIEKVERPPQVTDEKKALEGVDLTDVYVLLEDATDGEKLSSIASSPANLLFGSISAGSGISLKSIVFAIQATRQSEDGGWMITRSYSQFIKLYEDLRFLFHKIEKTDFPLRSGAGVKALLHQEQRDSLAKQLENWLNLLVPDAEIHSSTPMQTFMRPENITLATSAKQKERRKLHQQMLNQSHWANALSSSAFQAQVLNSIGSAGTLLRKAAIDTPMKAVSIMQHNLDNAVSGVMKQGARSMSRSISPNGRSKHPNLQSTSESRVVTSNDTIISPALRSTSNIKGPRGVSPPTIRDTNVQLENKFSKSFSEAKLTSPVQVSDRQVKPLEPMVIAAPTAVKPKAQPRSAKSSAATVIDEMDPQTKRAMVEWFELHKINGEGLEILLDCLFGLVEELFFLSEPNQWIRQKGLLMMKSLLGRSYGNLISNVLQTRVIAAKSPQKLTELLHLIDRNLWPFGIWFNSQRPDLSRIIERRVSTQGSIIPGFSESEAESVLEYKMYLANREADRKKPQEMKKWTDSVMRSTSPLSSAASSQKSPISGHPGRLEEEDEDDYFYYDTKTKKTRHAPLDMSNRSSSKHVLDPIPANATVAPSIPSASEDLKTTFRKSRRDNSVDTGKPDSTVPSETSPPTLSATDGRLKGKAIYEPDSSESDDQGTTIAYQSLKMKSLPQEADLSDEEVVEQRRLERLKLSESKLSFSESVGNGTPLPTGDAPLSATRATSPVRPSADLFSPVQPDEEITADIYLADASEQERIFASYGVKLSDKTEDDESRIRNPSSLPGVKSRLWRRKYAFGLDGRAKLWDKRWEYSGTDYDRDLPPIVMRRTEEMMSRTKMEAKQLFTNPTRLSSSVDSLSRILGRGTTVQGLTRVFNMFQQRQLNKQLIVIILDEIVSALLEVE